jgi:uncharacterized protein YaeQ
MALSATLYHLQISLSDVDRNVYEELDLRVAQHPSETLPYLLTRTLAYALSFEEGIEMGPGLCESEEPAVRVKDAHGSLRVWIDVGTPSADRMHRASKAAERVVIFTHHDPKLVQKEAGKRAIHRVEHIVLRALDSKFLSQLAALTTRNCHFALTHNDGQLYVKLGERTLETTLETLPLVPS